MDYPLSDAWWIYLNADENWMFQRKAQRLVADSDVSDGRIGQWEEQMIAETAISEHLGINSFQKNVAVRVNLHLHRQAFYGTEFPSVEEFEDDWED